LILCFDVNTLETFGANAPRFQGPRRGAIKAMHGPLANGIATQSPPA